jgi:hypothetical protein
MRIIGETLIVLETSLNYKTDFLCRVTNQENSLVWHQQVLGWINKYSGIGASNPDAVSLDDTIVPVVDYNP